MRTFLAGVLLIIACAATTTTAPPPTSSSNATPSSNETLGVASTPTVEPSATPQPTATPRPQTDITLAPKVSVAPGGFAIMTTLRTKLAVVDEEVVNAAKWGVERYLSSIDSYRNGQSPVLPITGPFLAAVSAALKESAEPGVKRQFKLESLTVDRHVQKPWGTHAYIEVTVTLVDRAVDGNAPDQRETGKLRLTGDKLFVTDGWDYDNARWFNGFSSLPLDQVRVGVAQAVSQYLWFETWLPNTTPPAVSNWTVTPFQTKRADRVKAIDRGQVTSQKFENVSATVEQFETIDGIWSGVATVHLSGTVVTTNATGATARTPFERRVRVFLLGNWIPEVVDEQLPFRDWASGGDLALGQVDVNRA